jgi:hypothetical protein
MPTFHHETSDEVNYPGLTEEQMQFLFELLCNGVSICCQQDQKERHFMLMVFTRDSIDHATGDPTVTTDLVTTLNKVDTHQMLRDWLHRQTQ